MAIEQDNSINFSTEPHTHDFHQFLYLRQGRCGVRIDDRRYEVVESSVATMLPGQAHQLEFPAHTETPFRVVRIKVWLNPTAGFPDPPELADCRQVRPRSTAASACCWTHSPRATRSSRTAPSAA